MCDRVSVAQPSPLASAGTPRAKEPPRQDAGCLPEVEGDGQQAATEPPATLPRCARSSSPSRSRWPGARRAVAVARLRGRGRVRASGRRASSRRASSGAASSATTARRATASCASRSTDGLRRGALRRASRSPARGRRRAPRRRAGRRLHRRRMLPRSARRERDPRRGAASVPQRLDIAPKLGGPRTRDDGAGPCAWPEQIRRGCEEDITTPRRVRLRLGPIRREEPHSG